MRKATLAAILCLASTGAMAQSSPNWTQGYRPTPAEWNHAFAVKQDVLGYTPINQAGGVFTGRVVTAPSGASTSGFNLTCGPAPASPSNGDLWCTTAGLFVRANGSTLGPLNGGSPGTNSITRLMLAQGLPLSLIGNCTNGTANETDVAGTADQVMRVNSAGTSCGFGQVNLGSAAAVAGQLPIANGGTGGATAPAGRQALNVWGDGGTNYGNTNVTIAGTDRAAFTNAAFTAPRVWTLPAANVTGKPYTVTVGDMVGGVTGTNTLQINAGGSDTINGGLLVTIASSFGSYICTSDGVSRWSCQSTGAASAGGVTSVACGPGLSGGTITTSGQCSIDTKVFNFVTAPPYSALCNGADDSAALQAAITAMPTYQGILDFPMGALCYHATALNWKGKYLFRVSTPGGFAATAPASNAAGLVYTGSAGSRANDFRNDSAGIVEGLWLTYSSASFTGYIVDAGGVTSGVDVSSNMKFRNNYFGPTGAAGSAPTPPAGCLFLDQAIETVIADNNFSKCNTSIHGELIAGMNVVATITGNQFTQSIGPPIVQCGENWTLINNTFEPDINGRANAFSNNSTLPCKVMNWIGNWMGDVTLNGGEWMPSLTADGFVFSGNRMSSNAGSNNGIELIAGHAYAFIGNLFDTVNIPINCNSGADTILVQTNHFISAGTPVGTPASCTNLSTPNNIPNVTTPAPTFTATFAGTTPGTGFVANMTTAGNGSSYRIDGNVADFWIKGTITSQGTASGGLAVGGLPFTIASPCVIEGNDQSSSQGLNGASGGGASAFSMFRTGAPSTFPAPTGAVIILAGRCPIQ